MCKYLYEHTNIQQLRHKLNKFHRHMTNRNWLMCPWTKGGSKSKVTVSIWGGHQDAVYHSAIRFALVSWPSLHIRHQTHWLQFIYKSLLGKAPPYLSSLVSITTPTHSTGSSTGPPQSQHLLWSPVLPVLCCQWLEQIAKIPEAGDSHLPHSLTISLISPSIYIYYYILLYCYIYLYYYIFFILLYCYIAIYIYL